MGTNLNNLQPWNVCFLQSKSILTELLFLHIYKQVDTTKMGAETETDVCVMLIFCVKQNSIVW